MADVDSNRGLPRGPFFTVLVIAILVAIRYVAIAYFGQLPPGYDYSARYDRKTETVRAAYNRHKSSFNPVGIAVESWEIEKMIAADIKAGRLLKGEDLPDPYLLVLRVPTGKSAIVITGYSSGISRLFPEYWAFKNQFEWQEGQ